MSPDSLAGFFAQPSSPLHRRYEVLRAFFLEGQTAETVARRFGYSVGSVYAMTRDFRRLQDPAAFFFRPPAAPGRPPRQPPQQVRERVIELRKANLSVPDIKARLDAETGEAPSLRVIGNLLRAEGFARLPRRTRAERAAATPRLRAPTSVLLDPLAEESFDSERAAGIFCLLPWIRRYGLHSAIEQAGYPDTSALPALQSVLAFVALKLSDIRRYSADDLWCMDRGPGLFAGLNVLPKTASLSAYADRTTRAMHQRLLSSLAAIWTAKGLVGDGANLDFTTLPHWGDDKTLQKHWSGTRGRSLLGISAALAQDPDSGILLYGDARVRRETSDGVALEFLSFSRRHGPALRYLVFDSRFTTYAQLARLDRKGIRFVTVHDQTLPLRAYGREIRQITLLRGTRRRPSFLLTNDFQSSLSAILRRYARRWLVEKSISEQLAFFHLNRLSSSMVIKVDFDLAITILAYNLLRLLACDLPPGYRRLTARSLYDRLLCNAAHIRLAPDLCTVALKKKRDLPALLEAFQAVGNQRIPWLGNRPIVFQGATTS